MIGKLRMKSTFIGERIHIYDIYTINSESLGKKLASLVATLVRNSAHSLTYSQG